MSAIIDVRASPFGLGKANVSNEMSGDWTTQARQLKANAGSNHKTPSIGEGQSNPPIVTLAPRSTATGR